MQPPGSHSDQDVDSRLSDPSLFSIHPARADAHTRQNVSATGTHSHPEHHNNGSLERPRPTSVMLSGDFNRHHPAWGGNHIQPRFVEDASELIDFFQTYGLHGCLPRGTATFWSLSHPGRNSTIDQTVTDRPDLLVKCHLYHENYGSDHRATTQNGALEPGATPPPKRKKPMTAPTGTRSATRCSER